MLAGLLFAVHDAEDRPDRPLATLPFAGSTLIEYQSRLLIAAGVGQIVIVVARLTPDLLGAIGRIGRRGVAVDAVRNAAEAVEKLHPLSRVLVLADGLVTSDAVIAQLAGEGPDALLVIGEHEAGPAFERIGGRLAWAGAARLAPARFHEVAAMPRDYDLQSALLRAGLQGGAAHLLLPANALAEGHGIEHRAAALDARGRTVLASAMSGTRGWFDRWVTAPIARLALPALVARGAPTAGVTGAGIVLGLGGLAAVHLGVSTSGLALASAALVLWALASTLARLRDEAAVARALAIAGPILAAAAALLLGERVDAMTGDPIALVAAIGLVTSAVLGERAIAGRVRATGWGSPGAYLIVLLLGAALGAPVVGLFAAAAYAAVTAGFAIEALRRRV